jgi:hypothetical protein
MHGIRQVQDWGLTVPRDRQLQDLQLEYKTSGKRGVWLAPAHLTLCLSAELLLDFR